MLVFYFLQGELGESMERPNAFVVSLFLFSLIRIKISDYIIVS